LNVERQMTEYSKQTIIEALLFASVEPVPAGKLAQAAEIKEDEVVKVASLLNEQYEKEGRAFRILKISGGYQFRTLPELADYIRSLGRQIAAHRLSPAALETLSIVAYRQPIGRAEIEKIRGVNVVGVLRTLLERKLITVCGRAPVLGRPLLYGTTPEFLRYFGLDDLNNLPKESELEVILGEEGADSKYMESDEEEGNEEIQDQQVLL
jgi:segregation and condensation protein B